MRLSWKDTSKPIENLWPDMRSSFESSILNMKSRVLPLHRSASCGVEYRRSQRKKEVCKYLKIRFLRPRKYTEAGLHNQILDYI
jgi:hypothetical protein